MKKAVILVDNIKGENSYGAPERIDNGEATESVNMIAQKQGIIRTRGGLKPIHELFPNGFPIAHKFYKKTNGTKQEMVMTDDLVNTRLYQKVDGELSHYVEPIDINATTETISVAEHSFNDDDVVRISTDGTLPAGTLIDTDYYIVESTANSFKLSLTQGGAAVDLVDAGAGRHRLQLWDPAATPSPTFKSFTGWVLRHKFSGGNSYKGGMYQVVDKIIAGNGLSTNVYWDGEYAELFGAGEPKGWIFNEYEGRVLISGDEGNPANLAYAQPWDPTNPDVIQWGGTGYSAGGIIAINRNDGQAVTGIGIRDSKILIEKERSKYLMTLYEVDTNNPLIPKVVPFRRSFGTVAPRTVDEVDNDYISLAHDGFRSIGEDANYASLRATLMSTPIRDFVQDMNRLQQYNACGKFFDNKYFSAIPTNGSTTNDYSPMFDLVARSWYPLAGILARFFFVWEDEDGKEWLGIGSQVEKRLYILDPFQYFDKEPGEKIPYLKTWRSKLFDFGMPEIPKDPEKIVIGGFMPLRTKLDVTVWLDGHKKLFTLEMKTNEEGKVCLQIRRDGQDEVTESVSSIIGEAMVGEAVLGEGTGEDTAKWYKFIGEIALQPEDSFFEMQLRFYNSQPDEPFQINFFKLMTLTEDLSDQLAENFSVN